VYIVEDGQKIPLFETQKVYKKFFDFMTEEDEILSRYKDNFYDIKYIEVFVPNELDKKESIVVGISNNKRKKFNYKNKRFFPFYTPYSKNEKKVFSYRFLAEKKQTLETEKILNNGKYDSEYAEILKVNY